MNKKGMLGNIIGGFIVILVGVALLPIINNELEFAMVEGNVTGASESMVGLVTLFFGLAIMVAAISIIFSGLRRVGTFGGSSSDEDDDDDDGYLDDGVSGKYYDDEDNKEFRKLIKETKPIITKEKTSFEKSKFDEKSKYD